MMITRTRPIWAEISRSRLTANYAATRAAAHGSPLAVVKANAYGHGSPQCAPILAAAGAEWLGVTSVDEGILVREACNAASVHPHILVMCGVWHSEAAAVFTHNLTPVVWEPYHLDLLLAEAARRNAPLDLHLEIDTGMARQGIAPGAALNELLARISGSPLQLTGVMTHFASAEVADSPQNNLQVTRFTQAVEQIIAANFHPQWVHAGNSSTVDAAVELPALAALAHKYGAQNMPRTGLAMYGYCLPVEINHTPHTGALAAQLQPALSWKTRIVSLRNVPAGATIGYSATFIAPAPMRIALLPVGYADGYPRALSGSNTHHGGSVLIRGHHAPILGRVSMDLTIVDITHIPNAEIGDEVVLIGEQERSTITAHDIAQTAQTIPYEILCGISDRVPRIVVD